MTTEEIKNYLDSEIGQDIITIIAYTIKKTPTKVDDNIIANADDIVELVAEAVKQINERNPTDKEVKTAGIGALEKIAKLTDTPWDDRAVSLAKILI